MRMLVKDVSIAYYMAATCDSVVHWIISNARVVVWNDIVVVRFA